MAECGQARLPDGRMVSIRDHALKRLQERYARRRIHNPLRLLRCCLSYAERMTLSPRQVAYYRRRYGVASEHWIDRKACVRFVIVWNAGLQRNVLVTVCDIHDQGGAERKYRKRGKRH